MQPLNLTETLAAISAPRLSTYRKFFSPADDMELYGLYSWNEALSGCLNTLLNSVEVTMRNGFHRELSLRYGASAGTSSSDWYETLNLKVRSRESVNKITHDYVNKKRVRLVPAPSPDDVVSKLTLGFWKHLLDVHSGTRKQAVDWGHILPALLPYHSIRDPAYWAKRRRQDTLFARMDLVGDLRNRIAHLEPLWKTGPLMEEGRSRPNYKPPQVKPAPSTPAEAIDRLNLVHNRAYELLHWLSRHRADDYFKSPANARFRHLASMSGLDGFRSRTADRSVTLLGLRRMMRARAPLNLMVRLVHDGKPVAVIIPWEA